MKTLLTKRSLLLALLGMALALPTVASLLGRQVSPSTPPLHLWWRGVYGFLVFPNEVSSSTSFDTLGKQVHLNWLHQPTDVHTVQTITTRYMPTFITGMGQNLPHALLVAGQRTNGNTVIELWGVDHPVLGYSHPPDPHVTGMIAQPLVSITECYDANATGKDLVREAFPNRGNANEAFVQFDDSRDVYALQLTPPYGLNLVASPHPSSGVMHVAALDALSTGVQSRDHSLLGYVYLFRGSDLTLVDSNRDGILDSFIVISNAAEWSQSPLCDPAAYID